ncbi:glycosyltransferase [Luteolibacter sp. LG18]|uniref:glycosyltransferase n=1 Tax=Luteolibacter sp. LG18 TaxID=2819286 RepID=UPI0030C6769F
MALVTNMVAPYRVSFYNALAELCDLTVVVDTDSEFNRSWKLDERQFRFTRLVMNSTSVVVPRKRKDVAYEEQRQVHFSQRLMGVLRAVKPDVVLSNELGLRSFWSFLYSRLYRCPWLLVSEATEHTEGWVGITKAYFRKFLISQADGFWSNGIETTRFLINRGAASIGITSDMTGIATREFREEALRAFRDRQGLRKLLGLDGIVFLFAGRLESGKGIPQLLQAVMERRVELAGRCSLLFVGDGTLREEVESFGRELRSEIPVYLTGFVQPEKLPPLFAASDVFVMPTLDDNWPLVNLEALAAGLPQIYSIYNGGAADLNSVAGVGMAIDPCTLGELAAKLVECVNVLPSRVQGAAAIQRLVHYSPEAQAQRALDSISRSLGSHRA